MKISLVFTVIALVLCQGALSSKPTCQSIGCEGPFKLCKEKDGKPECVSLGPGPVQTCQSIGCEGPFKLCTRDKNGKPECKSLGPGPVQTCQSINCVGPFKSCTHTKDGKPICKLINPGPVQTCQSIGCVGPYKFCSHKNGKPECISLGHGPVQTCELGIKCPKGEVCVRVNECVKEGPICGKTRCPPEHICLKGKCEKIFIHPIRTEPPTRAV